MRVDLNVVVEFVLTEGISLFLTDLDLLAEGHELFDVLGDDLTSHREICWLLQGHQTLACDINDDGCISLGHHVYVFMVL